MIIDYSFSDVYSIRTNEIDQHKRLTVPALVQLMQESSMQNVIELGASVWDLENLKVSWVLLRKELQIKKLPKLGEKVKILTYPSGFDRVFAYRDYKAFDESGNILAFAGSTWTLMNTDSRKMVRIPTEMFQFDMASKQEILDRPVSNIERLQECEYEKQYAINWYNLDWNGHVNNVFLIRCILESVPDDFLIHGEIDKLTVHFRAESVWKDDLNFQFQRSQKKVGLHSILRQKDNKVIGIAKSEWK